MAMRAVGNASPALPPRPVGRELETSLVCQGLHGCLSQHANTVILSYFWNKQQEKQKETSFKGYYPEQASVKAKSIPTSYLDPQAKLVPFFWRGRGAVSKKNILNQSGIQGEKKRPPAKLEEQDQVKFSSARTVWNVRVEFKAVKRQVQLCKKNMAVELTAGFPDPLRLWQVS